jgi:hypothetical protein
MYVDRNKQGKLTTVYTHTVSSLLCSSLTPQCEGTKCRTQSGIVLPNKLYLNKINLSIFELSESYSHIFFVYPQLSIKKIKISCKFVEHGEEVCVKSNSIFAKLKNIYTACYN